MTHEEIDRLWFRAMEDSIRGGEMVARYHFAALVAAAERNAILQMSREQWFKTQADFEEAIRARSNT